MEFNLVYRWHSAISKRDELWTEDFYEELFGDVDPLNIPLPQFLKTLGHWEAALPADPGERVFGGMERGQGGKFADDDLVKILVESIEDPAGKFYDLSIFAAFV